MRRVVIIPTYNECENVARMTDKVMSLEGDFDLLTLGMSSSFGTPKSSESLISVPVN